MNTSKATLLALLEAAAAEPIGLLIQTSDFTNTRATLYRLIKEGGFALALRASPFPEGDLVICHTKSAPRWLGPHPDLML